MSILDQLKKLDEQRAALIDNAKKDALAKAEAAIGELNSLGFSYKLTQGDGTKSRKSVGTVRQLDPDKPCSICNFATVPNHDARKHRGQEQDKKPFTVKQLDELGMKKK